MSKATGFMIFVAGAVVGSVATWLYMKKQSEPFDWDQIEPKKSDPHPENDISEEPDENSSQAKAEMAREKPSVAEYAKRLSKEGYTDYSKIMVEDDEEEESDDPGPEPERYFGDSDAEPRVISPEEFGEEDDYDQISITYYADHILADDNDQILEDVEGTVGFESLTHFGEYEDDSVHVRNDRLKTDYEILRDERKYSDVIKTKPYLREV